MVETTKEIEQEGKPVVCDICRTVYDNKEGKSTKHKIIDTLMTPKVIGGWLKNIQFKIK